MTTNTWKTCYSSICSISFFDDNSIKIGSGTGFKVDKTLITNNHIFGVAEQASYIELNFVDIDGSTIKATKTIPKLDFQSRFIDGLPLTSWDFAILRLDDTEFDEIPSLELAESNSIIIGQSIAILGFQFDQTNLSIKTGILSSRFEKVNVKYLQLDASINQGNSGGPLIDISTNKVVGIVTRKHTGLSKSFDKLEENIKRNIHAVKQQIGDGLMIIGGVDVIQLTIIGQQQLQHVLLELRRIANVGVGYAYDLEKIMEYFKSANLTLDKNDLTNPTK